MWQKWTFDVLAFFRRYNMLAWFVDHILWPLDSVRGCLIPRSVVVLEPPYPTI